MGEFNGLMKGPLTRLFEKVARWIGLSSNAGPVLAVFFLEQYGTAEKLSSEDICRLTGYSRANAGLIISQLEALGVVEGARDYDQTGRGRKRVLYSVKGSFTEIFELGVISIQDRLDGMIRDLDTIENLDSSFRPSLSRVLKEVRTAAENKREEMEMPVAK